MSERRSWWLIAYDIREPKRWRLVYRHLRGVGQRLQYSVFRARLSERELQKLRWELEKRMSLDDLLLVICLCQGCASKVVTRGELQCESWDSEPERWRIVG